MKFYPSDWRSDPALRSCTIAARGLWIEMMAIMHEAEPYGSLLVKGKRVDKKQLAALVGVPERECTVLLLELEGMHVFERDTDGTIYSRRMRRDHAKATGGKKEVSKRWGEPDGLSRSQRLSMARAKGKHTALEWDALLEICAFKCVKCGGDEGGRGVVKDHIVPIYRGGSDGIENLQPLCQPCNASKGPDETDHRRHDWLERLQKRLGGEGVIYGKTPTQKPEARSQTEDEIVPRGGAFTSGSKALTHSLWRALGIESPLQIPPELAGADWRAIEWERAGWTGDLIEVEGRRIGPGKPLVYYEKVFATAFAKRSAPLPNVEIRQAETLTVTHGTHHDRSANSLTASIRRDLAALEQSEGIDTSLPTGAVLRLSN